MNEEITRLSRDLRQSAALMGRDQIRYLVDLYYQMQKERMTAAARERQQSEEPVERADDAEGEPVALFGYFRDGFRTLENQAKAALTAYAEAQVPCQWAMSQRGIGPVISAGLSAEIAVAPYRRQIARGPKKGQWEDAPWARSASHVISFAGLAPGVEWKKGQKRPWSARLKVLAFKAGDCFMKSRNIKDKETGEVTLSYYGDIYETWKKEYQRRNEAGVYEERAEWELENKNYSKATDAYKAYASGRLPKARIEMMARRKAVHRFLVHFWWVSYEHHWQKPAPRPWVEAHGGHTDIDPPPGWSLSFLWRPQRRPNHEGQRP